MLPRRRRQSRLHVFDQVVCEYANMRLAQGYAVGDMARQHCRPCAFRQYFDQPAVTMRGKAAAPTSARTGGSAR